MTTEVTAADEVVTIEQRLNSTLVEIDAVEGNIVRLADEVAGQQVTGGSVTKLEESVTKARALADNLRSRRDALRRRLTEKRAIAEEDAAKAAKADAADRKRAAESASADASARLARSLPAVTLDIAALIEENGRAQAACAELGPGIGTTAGDPRSWYVLQSLLDEAFAAACLAAGAVQESHRITLTLRIPALGGAS